MYNCAFDSLRGYSYKLPNSIVNCPDLMEGGILMPLANSLQFFNGSKTKTIYQGKREISAIDRRGYFVGIGERASPGQLISAVLLDTRDIQRPKVFNYQKTQITHMAIAPNGEYFCTVGSTSQQEDELIIIQTENQSQVGTKVFFSKQFKRKDGKIMSVKFSNRDPTFFVLLCVNRVLFFRIDAETGAVEESMARTSRVREYNNFIFSPDDQFLYCCSKNGDISEVSIEEGKQIRVGPRRRVITKGISNLKYLHPGFLVICGKEGLLAIIELKEMRLLKEVKLQEDEITSMSEFSHGQAFIATNHAVIYRLNAETLNTELFYTCCSTKINSIAFLKGYSEIFGTCSGGEIIVWKTKTLTPALRIALPKVQCLSLHFPKNGKYIISGWSDDSVRVFSPKNGKLIHRITECNLAKVCDITSDQDSMMAICGGQNGVIRIWNLIQSKIFGLILGSLAYHMQRVNCLRISPFNPDQLVSCCDDGSYALWSLSRFQLRHAFHMMNFIKDVHFVDQLTIRLAGSGNIIYECFLCDGIIKREIEVAGTCINSMVECNIQATGERLLIYGGDCPQLSYFQLQAKNVQLIRLQSYGDIAKVMLAPNLKSVLAVTNNGIIISYFIFPIKQMKDDLGWMM